VGLIAGNFLIAAVLVNSPLAVTLQTTRKFFGLPTYTPLTSQAVEGASTFARPAAGCGQTPFRGSVPAAAPDLTRLQPA
jgi:hypothetical protein